MVFHTFGKVGNVFLYAGAITLFTLASDRIYCMNEGKTELSWSGNEIIKKGSVEIAKEIAASLALIELNLYAINLSDNDIEIIIKGIQTNPSLKKITLQFNNYPENRGDTGAKLLKELLKSNKIAALILFNNNFDFEDAGRIACGIQANTSLTELNIAGNNIGKEGLLLIADALKGNSSITNFRNHQELRGDHDIETRLQRNKWLQPYLYLRHKAICCLYLLTNINIPEELRKTILFISILPNQLLETATSHQ